MSKSLALARHYSEPKPIVALTTSPHEEGITMQYTMLIYQSPAQFAARTDPASRDAFWGSFVPYMKALYEAGIVVAGTGLEPPETATTVNLGNGQRLVQDGPYADTKEQLGGLFIIDVADLDTALAWAARCPGGSGTLVEIRPNLAHPPAVAQ